MRVLRAALKSLFSFCCCAPSHGLRPSTGGSAPHAARSWQPSEHALFDCVFCPPLVHVLFLSSILVESRNLTASASVGVRACLGLAHFHRGLRVELAQHLVAVREAGGRRHDRHTNRLTTDKGQRRKSDSPLQSSSRLRDENILFPRPAGCETASLGTRWPRRRRGRNVKVSKTARTKDNQIYHHFLPCQRRQLWQDLL